MLTVGAPYIAPAPARVEINQNAGWKFSLNPGGTPQTPSFNDSSWANVSLPHTWNNIDAASNNYAQGNGWYRKTINVDASLNGKRLYFEFEGAMSVTTLYIDGTQVDYKPASTGTADSHSGGFSDFLFDVTSRLTTGTHTIAVQTYNSPSNQLDVPPSNSGDYSRQGGIYRDVSLVALPQTRVARLENVTHTTNTGTPTAQNNVQITGDVATPIAGPGIYLKHTPVQIGSTSTTLSIRTVLDNTVTSARPVNVTSYLVDAAGVVRAEVTTATTLGASASGVVLNQSATLANPHLWNGRIDPYLYTLNVEVRDASTNALVDVQTKKVGIRSFTINANAANNPNVAPFLLNGERYTLVGANAHQDTGRRNANGDPIGWAQPDAMIRADVDLLLDAGATVIRTSHYQHNQAFYDYCDQVGMLVYTEIAINGTTRNGNAFLTNSQDMYHELLRQTQMNPSVFAWGFANETTSSSQNVHNVFTQLNNIGHTFDNSRKTALAQYGGHNSSSTNADGISDIKGTHRYDGWYIGFEGTQAVQNVINAYPSQPLGITEFGAGASAYHFADNPIIPVKDTPNGGVVTRYHPANAQAQIVGMQWTQYDSLNNLWARIVWQAFDHGSSGKNEGDQSGVNDKGLTTRDRTLKDSYHYYSSIWNDPTRNYANRKVLQLADTNWTVRSQSTAKVVAYSNIGAPTLSLNGVSLGLMAPLQVNIGGVTRTIANAYTLNVTLPVGKNTLKATRTYTDGVTSESTATAAYYDVGAFNTGTVVASGVAINRTFSYSPVYKTTSNPFQYALANGTYNVRITSPGGGVNNLSLEGQTATVDSNGLAAANTFYTRVTVADGQLTIAGAAGAVNAAVSTIDISSVVPIDTVAPAAAAIINDGAVQRSRIDSIKVIFTEPVTLSADALTLGLRNPSGEGYSSVVGLTASNPSNDGKTFLLSLSNGNSLANIADGQYDVKIDASKVKDLAGNAMASNYTYAFHRLRADTDGNRVVDFSDFLGMQTAYGSSIGQSNYDRTFDFDDDGTIFFNDFLILQAQYGKTV